MNANKTTRKRSSARLAAWLVLGILAGSLLTACEKKEKTATAGGGSSTQGILTIQGAGQ